MARLDIRLALSGKLNANFREYLAKEWQGQHVSSHIVKRALQEFLEKQGYWPNGRKPNKN